MEILLLKTNPLILILFRDLVEIQILCLRFNLNCVFIIVIKIINFPIWQTLTRCLKATTISFVFVSPQLFVRLQRRSSFIARHYLEHFSFRRSFEYFILFCCFGFTGRLFLWKHIVCLQAVSVANKTYGVVC